MLTLIKSGSIVTAAETIKADLLIADGIIQAIGQNIPVSADEVIDASGMLVLPGGVDAHVHLDLPMAGTISSDDHYTGTKAAAFGGTTTVIDFISQDSDDLIGLAREAKRKADAKVAVDYSYHMNITHYSEVVDRAIPELVKEGITSLKVFTAYNGRLRLQDSEILQVMRTAKRAGMLTMMHAENGDVIDLLIKEAIEEKHLSPIWHARTRPGWGAAESVATGAGLAATAGTPLYIVHVNTKGEVDQLEYARRQGIKIMGETCPQYLCFTEKELEREDGAKWVCSPPVRTSQDQLGVWRGLREGMLQTIATDHCPFFFDGTTPIEYEGKMVAIPGKELGRNDFTKIPNGLPGIGDRMPVMWTEMVSSGRFSANQFVELTCANPAKIFGMYPKKGCLQPGADADVVLWDPNKKVKYGRQFSQQRTDYNLYEGWDLTGFPIRVLLHGKTIVENGKWFGKAGEGRFVPCKAYNEII